MDESYKVIDFDKQINPINSEIQSTKKEINQIGAEANEYSQEIYELQQRMQDLASEMKVPIEVISLPEEELVMLNNEIYNHLLGCSKSNNKGFKRFPKLSTQDTIVCSVVGLLSVLIDVIFVGTPEIVRIYKGGQNFDGSLLTGLLRKIGKDGAGELSPVYEWFEDKFKVPYDISLKSGVLTPNNHRLRSFAHDPFLGLLFAVADIILGTTTCVDNKGKLIILINPNKTSTTEKWLAVIYYLGHLISDINTSRGLPIPGFFMTQFFTKDINDSSISKIAESMYIDGYDLRHMASMAVPVLVKDMLIKLYLELTREKSEVIMTIAEREKAELDFKLKKYKMLFITDSVATTGNLVKFVAPPNLGNPCSLNLVQWMSLIKNGLVMAKASARDTSAEEVMHNRKRIDERWGELVRGITEKPAKGS